MDKFFGSASAKATKELYESLEGEAAAQTNFELGPYNTTGLLSDAKRVGFLFARHKFVAKMLHGSGRVFEIGCQEGLGSMLVAQSVGHLTATDFFKPHIESCRQRLGEVRNIEFRGHDIIDAPVGDGFDGGYSMDVIEHIDASQEDRFMLHAAASLREHGVFVLGAPSLESQAYASPASREGHINCKTGEALRALCRRYFHSVFMFGMNDEIVHTGFLPMAHYLIALCVHPKRTPDPRSA